MNRLALSACTVILALVGLSFQVTLQYMVLSRVPNTNELMWFLFFLNIPILVVLQVLAALLKQKDGK